MKYNEWREHIQRRTDFTTRITHLTRSLNGKNAFENLINILETKKIYGSTTSSGFIVGDDSAVCFQDSPLLSIVENLLYEKEQTNLCKKIHYEPYGLRFNKSALYRKGARAVIYDTTEHLKDILPPPEYWRIVNLDLSSPNNIIDWTHEREWRIKGDLQFEYSDIEILVFSDEDYQNLIDYFLEKNPTLLRDIHGIIPLQTIIN